MWFVLLLLLSTIESQPQTPAARTASANLDVSPQNPKFWRDIAKNDYAVPAGMTAASLSTPLLQMLGSPDPEIRDGIAYTTFAYWIYQKRLLTDEDLGPIVDALLANLTKEVGSMGNDSVLRRSFSALVLSVVVARDNSKSFLDERQFRAILDGALVYADAERDVRGYDPEKGWIHSAAHTADLLRFLGRSRYINQADQARILNALSRKMRSTPAVFSFGEDERMARAVLSICSRQDFDLSGFEKWVAASKPEFPKSSRPQLAELQSYQNLKNLFSKLEVLLISQPDRSQKLNDATSAVEGVLKGAF